ncbi:hypothetical protein RFI_27422, partial [Reticulomyxa filosa]
ELKKWKETLTVILSFCKDDTVKELCNLFGQRLVTERGDINGAIACYLCSQNMAQLIHLWNCELSALQSREQEEEGEALDLVLRECIERAFVFINAPNVTKSKENVEAVASILGQYATLLADQGSLQLSDQYEYEHKYKYKYKYKYKFKYKYEYKYQC